ncbi:sporulation protein [Rhodoferax koreense]|uniref:Sporulation protein n=1 Tax=Rhodoferax koreensis TaxID=1842727 RepID=A0A1P8JUF2_9BURK|nr:SPOR domain-containing protein [Rhodoferax koreense]APW37358.1 sporulation protein [Rhodoferax koreense]
MAFFKFRSRGQKGEDASSGPTETIEGMRRRAKHRLIGAAILVLLGVIGFPLLFDSQPRPIPVNIAIDIPDKGKAKPIGIGAAGPVVKLDKPAETTDPAPVAAAPAASSTASANNKVPAAASLDSKEEVVASKAEPATPTVPKPEKPAPVKPEPHPEPKPEPKPVAKADESGARAKALLEGKDAPSASADARFVVQVGAFSDAAKAREARQKVERAGLKTYTQVVDTKDGPRTRVRVGPFANKAEADKAASKIKGLELSASILTL